MNSINSSDNSSEKKQNYYLTIDEHGYILQGEKRITDSHLGKTLLENIRFAPNGAFETEHSQTQAFVEAFDEPLIAHSVSQGNDLQQWMITTPYEASFYFDISTLTVDEWDRFHGITSKGIPFVFSKKARSQFFDLLEEFDDDSITIQGQQINIPAWLSSRKDVHSESYWSQIYQTENPGWELNQAAPALIDMLPRLKLPKSKVLILGCGSGNDAAHFAEHGHVVTAVDIAPEAVQRGKEKFKHLDIRLIS